MPQPTSQRTAVRFAWFLALLAVVVGELLPGNSLPMRQLARLHIGDKVQHFTAYAVLGFYPAVYERVKVLIPAAFGLILLGVLLEFGQLFSPGRSFEVGDMAANALGVVAGIALGLLLRRAVNGPARISPTPVIPNPQVGSAVSRGLAATSAAATTSTAVTRLSSRRISS